MDEEDQIEKKAKQSIRDGARAAKNIGKKLMKQAIKALIKLIGIKGICIALLICVIVVTLPAIWYVITEVVYDTISEVTKSVTEDDTGEIAKIVSIQDREYHIDTEQLEKRLNEWFKVSKTSKEQLGLSEDLSGLKKFLEVEITTSYPDLRQREQIGKETENNQIQGCVQFHRRQTDGTTQILEYMPYDAFATELAKVGIQLDAKQTQEQIYFEKEQLEEIYDSLKDKFTLDEDNNLIVVNAVSTQKQIIYSEYAKQEGCQDEMESVYDIEVTRVNYQNVIQKYTMPFEFCLALLLTSQSYEFCESVVELAKDSNIIIDLQDNITKSVTTEIHSFEVEFKVERYISYYTLTKKNTSSTMEQEVEYIKSETQKYTPYPLSKEENRKIEPYKTSIYTLENNDIRLCVRQAETWISSYQSVYDNVVKNTPDEDCVPESDGNFEVVEDYHGLISTLTYELPQNAYIEEDRGIVQERKYNEKTIIKKETYTNEYYKSSAEVEVRPEKFLSLLKIDPDTGVFDVNNLKNNSKLVQYKKVGEELSTSPQNNLKSAKEILYQLLGSNAKTLQLEETMRYLLNIYEGKTKVEQKQDFEIYAPEEFQYIDGEWSAIWKNNYTKSQFVQMVKAYVPPDGKGNGGRSYREYYQSHFVANAENYFDIATTYGLDPMFIFCIGIHESAYGTSNISYQKGNFWGWGAYDASPYQSAISFVGDASKGIETICKGIADHYVSSSGKWYSWIESRGYQPSTIEGIGARYASDSSWASSIKKYITTIFGVTTNEVENGEFALMGDVQSKMVQWATEQVGKTSFFNRAKGIDYTSKSYCAAFVKSAYYEAGLDYINGNAIDIPHAHAIVYDATGKVDTSQIPIGACIVSKGSINQYGHVALYVGNGYVIEAGGRTIVKNKIDESYGKKYGFLGWGYASSSQNL